MNKETFIKMLETLDMAKITYFNIKYKDYSANNNNNELNFENNQEG